MMAWLKSEVFLEDLCIKALNLSCGTIGSGGVFRRRGLTRGSHRGTHALVGESLVPKATFHFLSDSWQPLAFLSFHYEVSVLPQAKAIETRQPWAGAGSEEDGHLYPF